MEHGARVNLYRYCVVLGAERSKGALLDAAAAEEWEKVSLHVNSVEARGGQPVRGVYVGHWGGGVGVFREGFERVRHNVTRRRLSIFAETDLVLLSIKATPPPCTASSGRSFRS